MAVAKTEDLKYDQGDDETINLTVKDSDGNAQNISGWTFTLKVDNGDLFNKTASITNVSGGTAKWTLSSSETESLTGSYPYLMEFEDNNLVNETFMRGYVSWYDAPTSSGGGENSTDITVTTGDTLSVNVTTNAPTYTDEEVRDVVNSLLIAGNKLSWTYDDANDTLTVDTTALDSEEVEDQINSLLTAGNATTLTYDDAGDTLTVAVDESAISHDNLADVSEADHRTQDQVEDIVDTLMVAGDKLSWTYDDGAGTLTIDTSALDSEEVEDQVDNLLIAGNAANLTYDDAANTLTIDVVETDISHDNLTNVSLEDHRTNEQIQDLVDTLLSGGTNISLTYDDAGNSLTVDTTALDEEEVEDVMNGLVVDGNAVTTTYDDSANTLTIAVDESSISHDNITDVSTDDHHAKYTDEEVRDVIGTALTAGNNVSVTLDDNGDTITISAPDEDIQDVVDALLVAGNATSLTYDDNANTLTVAVDESAISHDNISGVSSDDHHAKYTDGEAESAINSDADHSSTASHSHDDLSDVSPNDHIDNLTDITTRNHNDTQNISSDDHHAKYTDAEARGSISDIFGSNGKADKDIDLDGHNAKNLGTLTFNADGTLQPGTDSTTAFQFQNAAGDSTILDIDTTNERVGIGTTSPNKLLTIQAPSGNNADIKLIADAGEDSQDDWRITAGGSGLKFQDHYGRYPLFLGYNAGVEVRVGTGAGYDFQVENTDDDRLFTVQGETGNVGINTPSPDTLLHNVGAYTQEPLSADPADPDAGNSVTWVSDGSGSGGEGDVMCKITDSGGTTKTITLIDYSAH